MSLPHPPGVKHWIAVVVVLVFGAALYLMLMGLQS